MLTSHRWQQQEQARKLMLQHNMSPIHRLSATPAGLLVLLGGQEHSNSRNCNAFRHLDRMKCHTNLRTGMLYSSNVTHSTGS